MKYLWKLLNSEAEITVGIKGFLSKGVSLKELYTPK